MRILHPTDFSSTADRALRVAVSMARAASGEVVLLHVLGPLATFSEDLVTPDAIERVRQAREAWAEGEIERRVEEIRAQGLPVKGLVRVGEPADEVVSAARELGADLIIMGTAGRGAVGRLLVGSVADRVVRTAPCPVVTLRQDSRTRLAA